MRQNLRFHNYFKNFDRNKLDTLEVDYDEKNLFEFYNQDRSSLRDFILYLLVSLRFRTGLQTGIPYGNKKMC